MRSKVAAVCVSCLHISSQCPKARAEKKNWFEVQAGYLKQLKEVSNEYHAPIVCCGDVFDRWNSTPETINFALHNLPRSIYAVAGNHDTPFHNPELMEKSAFATVCAYSSQGGMIGFTGGPIQPQEDSSLRLYGFPYNCKMDDSKLRANYDEDDGLFHLAVIHSYIWSNERNSYPGAPETGRLSKWTKRLSNAGFNAGVFGDNHKGFVKSGTGPEVPDICNCGTFIRRHANEIDYKPFLGLLLENGKFDRHYLDTSKDEFVSEEELKKLQSSKFDMQEFFEDLKDVVLHGLDFLRTLERRAKESDIDEDVRKFVLNTIEEVRNAGAG